MYSAFDSVMMLYVYEAGEYIMMRGLISGYVNVLPHNCGHIVRMSICSSLYRVLLTQQLNGMGTTIELHTISLFPNTIAILCASHGCLLLNLVDNDTINYDRTQLQ